MTMGWSRVWLGVALFAWASLFAASLLIFDSSRDLANGLAIALGLNFPSAGPIVNFSRLFGPFWFYLLSIPFALGAGVKLVVWGIGLLSAAKLWVAWRLGREWGSPMLGLAWAAILLVPGWAMVSALVPSHVSMVEVFVLLALWFAVRAGANGGLRDLILMAIAYSLAMHGHPTSVIYAPMLAWLSRRAWWFNPYRLGAALTAFGLPFLPLIVSVLVSAANDSGSTETVAAGASVADVLTTLWARLLSTPAVAWSWTLQVSELPTSVASGSPGAALLHALWAVLGLAALAGGLLALWRREWRLIGLIAYVVASFCVIVLMRDVHGAWMFIAILPITALAMVLAIAQVLPQRWHARASVLLAVCSLSAVLWTGQMLKHVEDDGELRLSNRVIADVAQWADAEPSPLPWIRADRHDSIARRLCGQDAARLHGDVAGLLRMSNGVALARQCGAQQQLMLGGAGAAGQVGLPAGMLRRMGMPEALFQTDRMGFVALQPTEVVSEFGGFPLRLDWLFPVPDPAWWANRTVTTLQVDIACPKGEWLLLSDLSVGLNLMTFTLTSENGPRTPDVTTMLTSAWRCDGNSLHLQVSAFDMRLVDVFRISAQHPSVPSMFAYPANVVGGSSSH